MTLFPKTNSPEPPPSAAAVANAGGKILLKFGGASSKIVSEMAARTLESGGFDAATATPKPPQIGDRMPDGTIYAGASPDTGKPMYAAPADAPLTMKWKEAMDYAAKLDAHGHQDWRLPTKGELAALFSNRAAIGGFNVTGSDPAGWYWSGTQDDKWYAWGQRFSDGGQFNVRKVLRSSVRCVR
jgi:uncharacterized protein DUF1566